MNPTLTVPVTTATLDVPGARLHYELRGSGPLLALVAAPMDAASFAPLADLLAADHTVLTADPRGINRSVLADPEQDCTPGQRADDLSRLLAHVDAGPATVLGSSGGAVTALALAQAHPEQLRMVIAHEPPFYVQLEDRDALRAAVEEMISLYSAGDVAGAWSKFLDNANIHLSDEELAMMMPAEPDPQAAADERYGFLHMLRGTTEWEPDVATLRDGEPRIVVGIGETSTGQLCDRISRVFADSLGIGPTMFPGDHLGFLEDPTAFAARLRAVLSS